ncbi:dihydrolipoyl dehydrogenase [Hydrogenovibrio kuenenii]|uniref:dihydrolipoyl dehydrogenase n=1 Tax=Hydrogenovibrio kuenenii TaxID=63658 RepID=UPI000463EBA3|nr:dihydrolipoyl dehydrogenase [Hydrogenovibrio kuenenii]
MRQVKYLILGAGSAGLTALGKIRKETDDFIMVNGGHFGTTCARVGCMPSKAMIHCADHFYARKKFKAFGIQGAEALSVDDAAVLKRVRAFRDRFTGGVITSSTDTLKPEQLIKGYAKFIADDKVEVNGETIQAERIIIATGSRPVIPQPWTALGDKLLTSDTLFELEALPQKVAVIGLGIIGLEIGQALSRLGVEVVGIEMASSLTCVRSPQAASKLNELMSKEFPIYLGQAAQMENTDTGVQVLLGNKKLEVDAVVASLGRRPNIDQIGIENIGVELDERGMPLFDVFTTQVGDKPIFIAGDVNTYRPILHEAGHEGAIAASNAITYPEVVRFARKTPLGVAFTDPQVGVFGTSFSDLNMASSVMAKFDLEKNNGRAIVMEEDKGLIVLYADKNSRQLLGGELVMHNAEHLTHLLTWAVAQQLTVKELLDMPFYHPVLEEAVESALSILAKQLYTQEELSVMPELS